MDMEYIRHELKSFIDEDGRITALPVKYKKRLIIYYYLAAKIEAGKQYTESQINDILDDWTTFHDPATLRRGLFTHSLLGRTEDCSAYWKRETALSLEQFIEQHI